MSLGHPKKEPAQCPKRNRHRSRDRRSSQGTKTPRRSAFRRTGALPKVFFDLLCDCKRFPLSSAVARSASPAHQTTRTIVKQNHGAFRLLFFFLFL